jgi:hypothetical protein
MSERYPVLPMPVIFPACYEILEAEIRAYHYVDLTSAALEVLGVDRREVYWEKQIEDVREKMADKRGVRHKWQTVRYTGGPECLVVLSSWLPPDQHCPLLFKNTDPPVVVRADARNAIEATFQALMRAPSMVKKTVASDKDVAHGRARGFQIEAAVTGWFKHNWPELYRDPDNYNRFDLWCKHDFKLAVGGRTLLVDVTGPNCDGQYHGPPAGKQPVDLHVAGNVKGDHFVIDGVMTGKEYASGGRHVIPISSMTSIRRLAFWLNCKKYGHDHAEILRAIATKEAA